MENNEDKQSKKANGKGKFPRKLILVLILPVLAAGGIGLFMSFSGIGSISGGPDNESGVFKLSRGDLTISMTESGDIQALNSQDIRSEVEGRTTIISIVDEGMNITPADVNNGKILVELDSAEIKQSLTQQEITFLNAEAGYTEAQELVNIQKKQNESDIQAGEMKARFALMDLQKYLGKVVGEKLVCDKTAPETEPNLIPTMIDDPELGGDALQKLRELNDNITLAESKFEQSSDTLMWTEKLYKKEYVAETKLREDQLDVQSCKIQLEKAKTARELFKLYEFPKEAETGLSDYHEAERDLERIKANARSKMAKEEAKLNSSKATYLLQKARKEKLEKQLQACVIKAPAAGQVVYSSSMMDRWMRRNYPIEVGAEIRERQKIISIPDSSVMKVQIKVPETWVNKIKVGQDAKITFSAVPDRIFTGKVFKKAPLADQQEWFLNSDLKVYATDVSIDGTHNFLKTGMSAKVEIIIERLKDVLSVPIQAVANNEGKKFCHVVTNNKQELREVETGAFNDNFVEIRSGLSEGDKVLLNPPRPTKSELPRQQIQPPQTGGL